MLELFVAWLHERFYIARLKAAMMLGILAWAIGLMALLSLNDWSMHLVFGMNFFEWLNALTSTFLLPLIALLLSVLVAWQLPRHFLENELITRNQQHFQIWYVTLKFVSVPTMLLILILGWIGGGG